LNNLPALNSYRNPFRSIIRNAGEVETKFIIIFETDQQKGFARGHHSQVTLLAIELAQLQQSPRNLSDVRSRIGELQKRASEITADIQSLPHELHSSRLQYLGIATAMRGFCKEFSGQQKVEIDFEVHDLTVPLSSEISLCFFRALQKACTMLQNTVGYGTSECSCGERRMRFISRLATPARGLTARRQERAGGGLISMEKRLKILKGTLSIESQLQRGTTIRSRVPLKSDVETS
jgi:signal transduction histidine kinase